MPVILYPRHEKLWLDTDISHAEALNLLSTFDETEMQAHTISQLINKKGIDKNTTEIAKPFKYSESGLLF